MGKNLLLPFSVILFIGVVIYYNNSTTKSIVVQNSKGEAPPTQLEPLSPTPPHAPSSVPVTRLTETVQEKISHYKPGKDAEYRQQLDEDPHQTPPVVIATALEFREIYLQVKSESEAKDAFAFFAKCAHNENVVALQTSCLRFAKRLTQNHPSLDLPWLQLEASASKEAKEILKFDQL